MSTGRQTVRAAALDKALGQHDAEIGKKMAEVLMEFHKMYVAPLAEEVAWLRQPWYRRAWLSTKAVAVLIRLRFSHTREKSEAES